MERSVHSAGGVVQNKNGEVLVVNQGGRSWSLPKGHVDPGEEFLDTARREILEESGLSMLTLVKQLPSYKRFRIGKDGGEDRGELKHIHMFLFHTEEMDLNPQDPDNPEARWVDPSDVSSLLTHPKDRDFFESIRFELR